MLARAQARRAVAVITAVTGAITPALAGTPALADSAPASLGLVRAQHVGSTASAARASAARLPRALTAGAGVS